MESWIAWLVLAALLGLAEIMTTTLALGLLAVAAVVAAVVGGLGLSLPFQLAAFVLAAGAGLGIVRPLAVRHIRTFLRAYRPVAGAQSMAAAAQ